jgi:hypothetical protein
MLQVILIVLVIIYIGLFTFKAIGRIRNLPNGYDIFDRGQYELILGENDRQLFTRYKVNVISDKLLDKAQASAEHGRIYLFGYTNYNPYDKTFSKKPLPFIFLNIGAIQNNYSNEAVALEVMSQCMHMAGIIYNGCWDSHEEEMINWAELESLKVIKLLKEKKYIR